MVNTADTNKNSDDLVLDIDDIYEASTEKNNGGDIKTYRVTRSHGGSRRQDTVQKGVLKKVAAVFLAVIIIFGLGSGVVLFKMFGISFIDNEVTVPREDEDFVTDEYDLEYANENIYEEVDADDVSLSLVEPILDDGLVNILLVGQDRREGETRARSDAMILCSINPETGKTSIISFLRDLYVSIPSYSDNRLNAAFAFGGFSLLKETLKNNFGVSIDGCFEADFDDFASLIDLIGGTTITLSEAEARIVGSGATSGSNHLNGAQTLTYARIRKIGTDFGRTERQRTVILACFDQLKGLDKSKILETANTALKYLSTDMTVSEITALITKLTPLIPKVKINEYFIPATGEYHDAMIKGMAVLVPDLQANRDLLANEYLPFE